MKLITDGFEFDFPTAVELFKFDEPDKSQAHYHGVSHCMKAVDVVAELPDRYLFIEIKNPRKGAADYAARPTCKTCGHVNRPFNNLLDDLVTKCRDTWLYRYCENKTDKPCHFICLINVDDTMTGVLLNRLRIRQPAKMPARWTRHYIMEMSAVNPAAWNRNYPHYGTVSALP